MERNEDVPQFLRDMASYFSHFEPLAGNQYMKLVNLLGGTRKRAVFVTTNYDMLIEAAVTRSGLSVAYNSPSSDSQIGIALLKIHGSCNFWPETHRNLMFQGIHFDVSGSLILLYSRIT